jgi:restriction system protein
MAKYWTIRAGRSGERVEWALSKGLVGGGWHEVSDLSPYKNDKDRLRKLVAETYGGSPSRVGNYLGQLWRFVHEIKPGDFMVLPIRSTSQVALGEVLSGYYFDESEEDLDRRHKINVKWLRTDIPKSIFKQDLLYQMGSAMTIFEVGNNDAGYRIEQVLKGHNDPGARSAANLVSPAGSIVGASLDYGEAPRLNLEEVAQDEISKRLQEDFKGHDLSVLIEALLTAEGFKCRNSPPGADGGVDVLAGMGALGMDSPKLVVQVKSQTNAVSDEVLQKLSGAIHRFKADQALLVTFGGVTAQAKKFLESEYFEIRVWSIEDILEMVYKHFASLPEELKARLPLKQIWVPIDSEG